MTTTTQASMQASIDRREKKYQTLVALIERWQRKLEKADKTMHKAVRTIATLERHRSKLRRSIERAKLALPMEPSDAPSRSVPEPGSEPVVHSVPSDGSDPTTASVPMPFSEPGLCSVPPLESEPNKPSKPKRQRKPKANGDAQPKAGDPGPELLAQIMPPIGSKPQTRAARMEAAGFRKVTKGR